MFRFFIREYRLDNGKSTGVAQMGTDVFRAHVMEQTSVGSRVASLIVKLINEERAGKDIDRDALKKTTRMFRKMGYDGIVEREIVNAAQVHYRTFAEQMTQQCSVAEYMSAVEESLVRELSRVKHYLWKSTEQQLSLVIDQEMISTRIDFILGHSTDGFDAMVQNDRFGDLGRVYGFLKRNGHHHEKLILRYVG